MSLTNWNYRGLKNLPTVKALEKVVSKEDPKYVFLMETKANMECMIMVRDRCKFKNGLIVPSEGKSGGLALFWKEDVQLDVQTYSQSHIDALVYGGGEVG